VPGLCAWNRLEPDRRVERDEAAPSTYRKGKQVDIRQLPRAVDARRVDCPLIEQAEFIGPELVQRMGSRLAQPPSHRVHG